MIDNALIVGNLNATLESAFTAEADFCKFIRWLVDGRDYKGRRISYATFWGE